MRRLLLLCGMLPAVASAQTTFALPDTMPLGAVERELLRFEQRRSDAIFRHDTAAIRPMYAPEFSGVTATGFEVNLERLLGVFTRDDPTTVFHIDELRVRRLGDGSSAVLSGRLITNRRSGEFMAASRFLHVYERRQGRWVIVAAQGTALPPR